jgi:hypothetical protein
LTKNVLVAFDQIITANVYLFFRLLPPRFCGLLQTKLCMLRCIYPFQKPLLGKENSRHFCARTVMWLLGKSVKKKFLVDIVGFVCDWLRQLEHVGFLPLACNLLQF